jgi:L-amino acid N-acyltransferase YncA
MCEWIAGGLPMVAVEEGGVVIAFAGARPYSARPCYRGIADISVYVARRERGRGAGRLALEALIAGASRAGFWKLLSRIFVENAASRKLVRSAGFREVGIYEKHGKLDGLWRDCVIVERLVRQNLEA